MLGKEYLIDLETGRIYENGSEFGPLGFFIVLLFAVLGPLGAWNMWLGSLNSGEYLVENWIMIASYIVIPIIIFVIQLKTKTIKPVELFLNSMCLCTLIMLATSILSKGIESISLGVIITYTIGSAFLSFFSVIFPTLIILVSFSIWFNFVNRRWRVLLKNIIIVIFYIVFNLFALKLIG